MRYQIEGDMKEEIKYGYMCGTDLHTELSAGGEGKIYPTVKKLKKLQECWDECGIVKVQIKEVRTVRKPITHNKLIEKLQNKNKVG